MQIFAETERLILREILPSDEAALFELDADPEVHRYLGRQPVTTMEQVREVIQIIRQQYADNGIGRWAIVEKKTGDFLGWTGLKLTKETCNNHSHYYDLGYRLIRRHWGRGYATESAIASVAYGLKELKLREIYGIADIHNLASGKVLEKAGLRFIEVFELEGEPHNWYGLKLEP